MGSARLFGSPCALLCTAILTGLFAALGCGGPAAPVAGIGVEAVGDEGDEQPLQQAPTYWYFRSNATGWELDEHARLEPLAGASGILALTFDVTEPWMVNAGDDAALVGTPVRDDWGPWQHEYTMRETDRMAPLAGHLLKVVEYTPFKLKYPARGRYKVSLNLAEHMISIMKVDPPPGEPAWGSVHGLVKDAGGRFFRQTFGMADALARVDPTTGHPVWVHALDAMNRFDVTCVDSDGVIVRNGPNIELLDVDGALAAPDADAPAVYAQPSCGTGSSVAVIGISGDSQSFVGVRRSDGAVLWQRETTTYEYVSRFVGDVVLLQHGLAAGTHYIGIDATSGAQQLTLDSPSFASAIVDERDQSLYLLGDGALRRVDVHTGATLWQRPTTGDHPWASFEKSALLLREVIPSAESSSGLGGRVTCVRESDGATLWSQQAAASMPTTLALDDGSLFLTESVNLTADGISSSETRLRRLDIDGNGKVDDSEKYPLRRLRPVA